MAARPLRKMSLFPDSTAERDYARTISKGNIIGG